MITPVYNPPLGAWLACARSVLAQTYGDWEWCIVDDCSTSAEIADALAVLADSDPRVRVHRREHNGGIVAASNDALAMAVGEFVVLMDHDDALVPTALAEVAQALAGEAGRSVDYLYTDEAHVLADGRVTAHFLKPAWSPERFRSSMYTCHLSALRRSTVDLVGGFRVGFDGSQDHDLVLRVTEAAATSGSSVVHLPVMAYHWRNISSSVSRESSSLATAIDRGRRAVQEQCDRLGIDASVVHGPEPGTYRLVRSLSPATTCTVVVATDGETSVVPPWRLGAATTLGALQSSMNNARFVVAYPEHLPEHLVELMLDAADDRWLTSPLPGPWSLAAAIDVAVQRYPADVVVSIAPGMVPDSTATPDWLETMVALALQPGVGLVGGLSATPGGKVVEAGVDVPNYRWYQLAGLPVGQTTSGNDLLIERECTWTSLSAAAVSYAHWREAASTASGDWAGAGQRLAATLADRGLRTIYTPYARFEQRVVTAVS